MDKDKIDIIDEKLEQDSISFNSNLNDYIIKYIIPDVIAFQLANSYYRGSLCTAKFEQHFNSTMHVFTISLNFSDVKYSIVELLKIKYNLIVVNENPLILEKRY